MNERLFESASDALKKLINLIQSQIKGTAFEGHVWLVGGAVRDLLLHREVHDVDLVVDIKDGGMSFAHYMTARNRCYTLGKNPVLFERFGTAKFNIYSDEELKDIDIECVQTRKEKYSADSRNPQTAFGTIEEDAMRRDLTINALYYNITTEKVHDFLGTSVNDMNARIIRTPIDPNSTFYDDPLRLLRCIRYSCKLGWGISKETWLGMLKNAHRISTVSQERITDEITKILTCSTPSEGITKMLYSGLLKEVLPDVYDMTTVYESKRPMVTTFEHTMKVLDMTQPYIENRLAALFHDVGKCLTDNFRTISQDEFSCDVAVSDLRAMKYPNDVVNSVGTAIRYHRIFRIYADGVTPPDKKIRKFINLCKSDIGTTIDLMHANNVNQTYGVKKLQALCTVKRIEELNEIDKLQNVKLPIDGKDIIKEFKIKPSPTVGIILEAVKDKYFENPSITREECLKVAKETLLKLTV